MIKRLSLLILCAFVLSGCGLIEYFDSARKNLKKPCPAPPAQLQTAPTLPGAFPAASGMAWTEVHKSGPSTIASGFMESTTIGPAHQAWAQAVKGANGYSVTKEEQDGADSEVSFSGNGKSGQVKMLQVCKSRTNVTITIRPA
jgi:hypothetical protein